MNRKELNGTSWAVPDAELLMVMDRCSVWLNTSVDSLDPKLVQDLCDLFHIADCYRSFMNHYDEEERNKIVARLKEVRTK